MSTDHISTYLNKYHIRWYNGLIVSHKKGWNNAISSNMDGTRDDPTNWSKSDRERQIPYDITCMWNLKYYTNELIYETETRLQMQKKNSWLPKGKSEGGGIILEFGISRYKLCVSVAQSFLTFCDPMDCSPPGSSVCGILHKRIPERVAISFSKGSSWSRDRTQVSCTAGRFFTIWVTGKSHRYKLQYIK